MSMDQPRRPVRPGGPGARSARANSPAIAVVVALVAAVLGFMILKALGNDDTTSTTGGGTNSGSTDSGTTTTSLPAETTPTTPPVVRSQFNILVANASGLKGSAKALSDQLTSLGYVLLAPTNATDTATKLTTTVVYFSPGADAIGNDVAASIGKTAQPMPASLPVSQTSYVNGHVLIMLGTDLAGKSIPGATAAASTASTPAAGASPNDVTSSSGG